MLDTEDDTATEALDFEAPVLKWKRLLVGTFELVERTLGCGEVPDGPTTVGEFLYGKRVVLEDVASVVLLE